MIISIVLSLDQPTLGDIGMSRDNPPITSLEQLLGVLYVEMWSTTKTSAVARIRGNGIEAEVIEYFDDGKGHSNAFTSEYHPLDWNVFEEALQMRYISGILKPGYVSKSEFIITREGVQIHTSRLQAIADQEKKAAEDAEIAKFTPNGLESD